MSSCHCCNIKWSRLGAKSFSVKRTRVGGHSVLAGWSRKDGNSITIAWERFCKTLGDLVAFDVSDAHFLTADGYTIIVKR